MAGKYTASDTVEPVFTTELNALADTGKKTSATFSNDAVAEREWFGSFILSLATTTARTATNVDLYLLPEVGDVFASGSDTVIPELKYYVGSFTFDLAVTAKVDILEDVRLPNANFKVLLINNVGVALAATGNTLDFERYAYEDV